MLATRPLNEKHDRLMPIADCRFEVNKLLKASSGYASGLLRRPYAGTISSFQHLVTFSQKLLISQLCLAVRLKHSIGLARGWLMAKYESNEAC